MQMKYVRKVSKPEYLQLVEFLDQRFGKLEIKESRASLLEYKTTIRLKMHLKVEMNINFSAQIALKKEASLTKIEISVSQSKIIFACILMIGVITTISYLINPGFLNLIYGLISGFIVYLLLTTQVNIELEKYLKNLLRNTKAHFANEHNL